MSKNIAIKTAENQLEVVFDITLYYRQNCCFADLKINKIQMAYRCIVSLHLFPINDEHYNNGCVLFDRLSQKSALTSLGQRITNK